MKKWHGLTLRELNKWQGFGRNLGTNASPWVHKYGTQWQHHLAKAVTSGKSTYNGLTVPKGLNKSEASLYLKASAKVKDATPINDSKPSKPSLIEHHYSNLAKIREDRFATRITRNVKKHVDPNVRLLEKHLKKQAKIYRNFIGTPRGKLLLDRFKKEKPYIITHRESPTRTAKDRKETDRFLRALLPESTIKRTAIKEMSKVERKQEMIRANFDFRDLGVAVGSIADDDEEYDKLIELLKSGKPIHRKAFLGICKSKKAKDRIIRAFGTQYWNDNFASKYHDVKYSSDRIVNLKYEGGYKPGMYKRGSLADRLKPGQRMKSQYYNKVKEPIKKK